MRWEIVVLSFLILRSLAGTCDNSKLDYTFTSCVNGTRKAVFFWKVSDCANALPAPIEGVSCDMSCPAGKYVGVDTASHVALCQDCPSNTYSTGSALRLSSADKNWNQLPKETELNCYWVSDDGYWQSDRCASYVPLSDSTAVKMNMDEAEDETWNILEFKLNVYLLEDGAVQFTYRKSTKLIDGIRNGRFRFDVGFFNIINDEDPNSLGQTTTVPLKKGLNELMWYYAFSTELQHSDLYLEISEINVSPVYHASLACTSCQSSYSAAGSSQCSGCPANFYSPSGTIECAACPARTMSYPGDSLCSPRPTCIPAYDAEPIFQQCANGKRAVTYRWRNDTVCDTDGAVLPDGQTVACASCPAGFFINKANNSACTACPHGYFSSENNKEQCERCSSGKYAPLAQNYEELEAMPAGFDTRCEMVQTEARDLCAFHSGWVVANGSFTCLPSVPKGVRLVLRKKVNVTQEWGYMEFVYKYPSLSSSDPSELLKLKIDGYTIDIALKSASETKPIDLTTGAHVLEWIYEKTKDDSTISPLLISSIRIEGESGSSDTCIQCPRGQYSSAGSAKCVACEPGNRPNTNGTACELCEEGTFKSGQMSICEACPAHTHSTAGRTKCELYEGYIFGNEYMLNMVKFASTRNSSINELKDTAKSGSFFGPFFNDALAEMYFFSLSKPMEYDVEKYEYEEDAVTVDEGHVFALMTGEKEDVVTSKDSLRKTHYRVKKNLGSKLQSVDIKNISMGEVTLEYVDGDQCEAGRRYSSRVKLACDKSVQSLARVESAVDPNSSTDSSSSHAVECIHNFVWRTPYACSQCKLSEAVKYYAKCIDGKRTIYLEDGASCIIHGYYGSAAQENFWVETMKLNGTIIMTGENDSSIVSLMATTNSTISSDFVYADEYAETCSEVELSYILVVVLIAVLIVVAVVAIITILVSLRYRKRYYQLLDGKSDSREMRTSSKPSENVSVGKAEESKKQ